MQRLRNFDQIRQTIITPYYLEKHPTSVLIEIGLTKVLCAVTLDDRVPFFLKNKDTGWITAEYSMLPCSGSNRNNREIGNRRNGRNMEIQRLIGRSLRTAFDLRFLRDKTLTVDCDVIQADGGTRTASITGAYVACMLAFKGRELNPKLYCRQIAAISIGIVDDQILLDLDYNDDSNAQVDCNLVMDQSSNLIEIQGTGEKKPFNQSELSTMLSLGYKGIQELMILQLEAIEKKNPYL